MFDIKQYDIEQYDIKQIYTKEQVEMGKNREDVIGYEIKNLNNVITRSIAAGARSRSNDELTAMHCWILGYLYNSRGRDVFQKDVEAEFSIGRSTVTNILQLMEKKDYIQRESVGSDARLKKIVMTPKGIKMHLDTGEMLDELEEKMAEGISAEHLRIFFQVIRKVRNNLENGRDLC